MAFAAIGKDAVREFDALWITAGWGCDGDTIAMTAPPAQPLGQVPWIPKTNLLSLNFFVWSLYIYSGTLKP
jgi:hypothetical protein